MKRIFIFWCIVMVGYQPSVGQTAMLLTTQVLSTQSPQLPPPANMKVLGLIGGTSWYSTVDYYRYINKTVNDAYGNSTNPPLILVNLNQERIHELQAENKWDEIARIFSDAVARLRSSGAQGILFCSNTSHKVYSQVTRTTDIPILHIGDATGRAIQQKGLTKGRGDWHSIHDGRQLHGRLAETALRN